MLRHLAERQGSPRLPRCDESLVPSTPTSLSLRYSNPVYLGILTLTQAIRYAKIPMGGRLAGLAPATPITFIYGEGIEPHHLHIWTPNSRLQWKFMILFHCQGTRNDKEMGNHVRTLRPLSNVTVEIVGNAGHHVYADQATVFNGLVNEVSRAVATCI